ncbi:hypothetical protein BGX34_007505 [Mortierella sp. NVP85]|nr:hypothetical protein BGX34_007505 [Mortierella sp. NVP85]
MPGPYSYLRPPLGSFRLNRHPQIKDEPSYHNPYRAPSYRNSHSFVPPKVPGYDFTAGSQAGNMGLMMGRRLSDRLPVTGKLHQSRVLLQHEYRILKRLKIANARYIPNDFPSKQDADNNTSTVEDLPTTHVAQDQRCHPKPGVKSFVYETGSVETEKYFNRVVEDFVDLEDDMSILILERLGPNLLSHTHHQFLGLEDTDGSNDPEAQAKENLGSPFPDLRTFLIFALKAACVLEALLQSHLAHLAISPLAIHWMPAKTDASLSASSHLDEKASPNSDSDETESPKGPHILYTLLENMDVNDTTIRLFDFTHSKILSHERARAPNNIVEWQIPGYLEYHLQFLAPEQTGRAETWMDHRTDIYGLGATLFSLLTMQYPNTGNDSVQILQGVLTRDLPSVRNFRPEMPPIVDDILRKMTQKQPSQRYQNAFGFKQDILRCLNALHKTGRVDSFELGQHDISYQFVLPNTIFGRQAEQQMISAAIAQAANAYQQSLIGEVFDDDNDDDDVAGTRMAAANNADHYVFEDDIVPLKNQVSSKIPLSSKTLLKTPRPFDGMRSTHRSPEKTDPIVRVLFVSGPSGVGKTVLIRGMATVARNSGLFAGGTFEAENRAPYSAILACVQSVLQQLLAQHTDALASLVVAIRTAFEPRTTFEPCSGIGVLCDLVPELKYFFSGAEMSESKDVPLTHSVTRFHALILKLIRVISTHFFMTWLIDDLQFADENSIDLLATLVNVNRRLPIVFIITHRDTPDCLLKVKHILGGGNIAAGQTHTGYGALGAVHHDTVMDGLSSKSSSSTRPRSKSSVLRGTGISFVVRGGGGVRYIRLQHPTMDTIQDFLAALLHRDKADVSSLATVLHGKAWLTIRQLVLELFRNQTIYFNCVAREWEWKSCQETLAEIVRKLTGEEYEFLQNRFRSLDCDTKRAVVCASICGQSSFDIQDLQLLVLAAYSWSGNGCLRAKESAEIQVESDPYAGDNKGCNAMAGIQSAIKEGILVYTSVADQLRFQHGIMRKVAANLLETPEEMEKLHFEMIKILFNTQGQQSRVLNHVPQCLNLIKRKLTSGTQGSDQQDSGSLDTDGTPLTDEEATKALGLDTRRLRQLLSSAGEKSQKSGAQEAARKYWNAAMILLPKSCWDLQPEITVQDGDIFMGDPEVLQSPAGVRYGMQNLLSEHLPLQRETLKLHLQCIEAERWRNNFDQAMKICEIILSKVTDPIDRARVYEHQIEMSVWAYTRPEQATAITIKCLQELGMPMDTCFNPSEDQLRDNFHETNALLMEHMHELQANPPKTCTDPKVAMMMEVLKIASSSLYYCNVPFMSSGLINSLRLTCKYGITKDSGRALASFALMYSTWYECLDNVYELGKLACKISNGNNQVRFLFNMTVQHWGEHVANSIPALEESLTTVDIACDRFFHTAVMIHISVMKLLVARIHLSDLMTTTMDLLAKHIEISPKSHGIEVMQGVLQIIKCLKGRTLVANPETIFDDVEYAEAKNHGRAEKKMAVVHNNSTYQMLKVTAAFIFEHYAFVQEVTDSWHDDSKSIMNFEGSWIAHSVFTVVGLSLASLLRTETDPAIRRKYKSRLFRVRSHMELRAKKYATNHASMYYLLEAEIADQGLMPDEIPGVEVKRPVEMQDVLLLYEKAIKYAVDGDFPLHKCFSYELAAKCYLRHGLVTSARCLMASSCKVYQNWGAKGKVQWFHRKYPELFRSLPEADPSIIKNNLFSRPNDSHSYPTACPLASSSSNSYSGAASTTQASTNNSSPWINGSPNATYSPNTTFGNDSVLAAATAMAESNLASSFRSGSGSATSSSSSAVSAPLQLQSSWLNSPKTPEIENADLDVLDFSSVIEAMQVIASEIDLERLLVKSLGVLNQSVGAKQCCVIMYMNQELVLAASLGDMGRCESLNPPMEVGKCTSLFHGVVNYVVRTSMPCLLTNAKDDPRFCADDYLKQHVDLKTVLCAPILHKKALVGVLYMEDFPERAFANKRQLVMNLLVQQLGISITNALLYQSVLQSEAKLNGLLENMPCGIALWDAAAEHCLYINSTWKDMTGFTINEIMESRWTILIDPDELIAHGIAWKERVQAGAPCKWECRYALKDGTFRWGITRMLPIMSTTEMNKVLQWVTVTIDIDDQRKAVQLKSNFLANMSHELRTPFSGILGMLSLLRDSSGLSHEQFEFVDMAKASCEMLIRIVDDLLNFSKLEADKVTLEYIPLCFEEILGDVCDLLVPLASRKGLELIILVDDTLPVQLIGDPDRMKQILMNLIGNAIKFSTSGNVVIKYWHELRKNEGVKSKKTSQISTKDFITLNRLGKTTLEHLKERVEMEMESNAEDEVVLYCSVTDQGIGMTPEEQKMLFVSFQQTDNGTTRKYGGTGLGLSICAQLIAHMNGKIVVQSEKDKGSTFTFSARVKTMSESVEEQNPAESSRIRECEKVMTARWDALRSKKVLILSPNKLLRQQIMNALPVADCKEFDSVVSAVEAGAIGILRDSPGCCSKVLKDISASKASENTQEDVVQTEQPATASNCKAKCGPTEPGAIPEYDFILVDHVLDSEELDCIYPSPSVAFVLLLAPTTETLRWILPPAQKRTDYESEETDSEQVDVGGRGRVRRSSELDFAERALGQVRSASYMSKIRTKSADKRLESLKSTKPSELFKRKKQSKKSEANKRRRIHGPAGTDGPAQQTEESVQSSIPDTTPKPSFHVCRMIKPVRRFKLLQIMYNALMHLEQQLSEESESFGQDRLIEISDESDGDRRSGPPDRERSPSSRTDSERRRLSGSESPARSASPHRNKLKRSRSKGPGGSEGDEYDSTSGEGSDKEQRARKAARTKASRSASSSKSQRNRLTSSDIPKRDRNNDKLTLLLTPDERTKCKGKNVLVAEDDPVSQMILEKQLSKLGMHVMIANNGQEAVNQWLSVERGHYTIAIFDHHMPIMDGLAATRKIRALEAGFAAEKEGENQGDQASSANTKEDQHYTRIPIVGLSADIQLATKEKCIKAGMDEYMTKPLLTQGLALLIQRYCCN